MPYTTFPKYLYKWLTAPKGDYLHICQPQESKQIDDEGVAIYCIHGTADMSSAFSDIVTHIKPELTSNVKSIHQVAFDDRFKLLGIEDFAKQLEQKIHYNNDKKVLLMGHSRGAIIASYYTENYAKDDGVQVEATINICGPFGGSRWAVFPLTFSKSIDQMRLKSSFLSDLTNKMKYSENNYHYFLGKNDELVRPKDAYIEEHKHNVTELDEDHLSIMSSPDLFNHLKNTINNTLEKEPTVFNAWKPNIFYQYAFPESPCKLKPHDSDKQHRPR